MCHIQCKHSGYRFCKCRIHVPAAKCISGLSFWIMQCDHVIFYREFCRVIFCIFRIFHIFIYDLVDLRLPYSIQMNLCAVGLYQTLYFFLIFVCNCSVRCQCPSCKCITGTLVLIFFQCFLFGIGKFLTLHLCIFIIGMEDHFIMIFTPFCIQLDFSSTSCRDCLHGFFCHLFVAVPSGKCIAGFFCCRKDDRNRLNIVFCRVGIFRIFHTMVNDLIIDRCEMCKDRMILLDRYFCLFCNLLSSVGI